MIELIKGGDYAYVEHNGLYYRVGSVFTSLDKESNIRAANAYIQAQDTKLGVLKDLADSTCIVIAEMTDKGITKEALQLLRVTKYWVCSKVHCPERIMFSKETAFQDNKYNYIDEFDECGMLITSHKLTIYGHYTTDF